MSGPVTRAARCSRLAAIAACAAFILISPPDLDAAPAPTRYTLIDIGPVGGTHNLSYSIGSA